MIKNKWYQLTPNELREVVNSPKNSGVIGSLMTFIIVMVNIVPVIVKHPMKFIKVYIDSVFTNFIKS